MISLDQAKRRYESGESLSEIAKDFPHIHPKSLYRKLKRFGTKMRRRGPQLKANPKKVRAVYRATASLEATARAFGVTRQTVRALLSKRR